MKDIQLFDETIWPLVEIDPKSLECSLSSELVAKGYTLSHVNLDVVFPKGKDLGNRFMRLILGQIAWIRGHTFSQLSSR